MNQRKSMVYLLALALTGLGAGCANGGDLGLSEQGHGIEEPPKPPKRVNCRMTGGGQIIAGANPDSFGGNAQPFRFGGVDGEWNHVTHEGDHFHGDPDTIVCLPPVGENDAPPPAAPTNAMLFSGTGLWNNDIVCDFVVYIEDHGEPGSDDYYEIEIDCGGFVYTAGDTLLHGNLQIHEVPAGHLPR